MNIDFYHVGAACFVLRIDGKIKIACDPCLAPEGTRYSFKFFTSTRIKPPVFDSSVFDDVHAWLITHDHADHIDETGVSKIDEQSIVITRTEAVTMLSNNKSSNLRVMNWNETTTFDVHGYGMSVRAIPAFHGSNPMMSILAGKVNGYLVTISQFLANRIDTIADRIPFTIESQNAFVISRDFEFRCMIFENASPHI
jgi:L-ascorbate metabolism protein UlaG (beta-lactamase superfamily)